MFCARKYIRFSSAVKAKAQAPRGVLMAFRHQSPRVLDRCITTLQTHGLCHI